MSDFTANEKSSISISLPMLIQAVVGIGALVAMWTSTQADLHALQKDVGQLKENVQRMENLQEKPIPSDIEQNCLIEALRYEVDILRESYRNGYIKNNN